jgi:NADPH2:quinone reductase
MKREVLIMTHVIRMHEAGGPEVLVSADMELSEPGPGEVLLRQSAIGLNYVDIYHRTGLYPLPLPAIPGVEGAGVIEALGPGVSDLAVGDRVAYAGLPAGAYAEARIIAAARLVRLPDAISDRTASAMMLRGITAHMLLHRVCRVAPGDAVLVHAAAGGLGLVLTQWAKRLGATVIGTVGSREKAETARAHGLDHAILYREADFVAEVRRLTGGRGVQVAYDGIGGDTLTRTLDCVQPFGVVASVGQAGAPLPKIEVADLGPRRSLSLARPSVFAYAADLVSYRRAARDLIAEVEAGMRIEIGATFPLAEAARAHRALEGRETVGSIVLVP